MFCNGTRGCKSKSFVVVDDGIDAPNSPVITNSVASPNPFHKMQSVASIVPPAQSILDRPADRVFLQETESSAVVGTSDATENDIELSTVAVSRTMSLPAAVVPVSSETTNLLWRFRPNGKARPARYCPVFDTKNRLFVSVSNMIAMFEGDGLATGTPQWAKSLGGLIRHPVLGPDGNLRIHASDGRLYSIAPDGNDAASPIAVGPPSGWSTPTIDRDGTVWLQLSQGGLTKIDPDGILPRRPFFRTGQRLDCSGLLIDDIFYVGGESGCVLAVDLSGERGENLWENNDRARTGWCINSALALSGSTLIVSSRDDILYGYSTSGERLWKTPMSGQTVGSPVVDGGGNIYIGLGVNRRNGNIGMLACVDGQTHQVRWEFSTPAPIESTPVIGEDGVVYFGDNDGNLFGIDGFGRLCWSDKIDVAVRSPGILFGKGRLAFGLDDGSFAVFSCPSNDMARSGWPKFRRTYAQNGNEAIL